MKDEQSPKETSNKIHCGQIGRVNGTHLYGLSYGDLTIILSKDYYPLRKRHFWTVGNFWGFDGEMGGARQKELTDEEIISNMEYVDDIAELVKERKRVGELETENRDIKAEFERINDGSEAQRLTQEKLDLYLKCKELEAEVERLSELLWGSRCIYCGEVVGRDRKNQDIADDVLREHTKVCKKHPVADLQSKLKLAVEALKGISKFKVSIIGGDSDSDEMTIFALRDIAKQALAKLEPPEDAPSHTGNELGDIEDDVMV